MKTINLLIFIKKSIGEMNYIIPIIDKLNLNKSNKTKIYFIFRSKNVYKKIISSIPYYDKYMKKNGLILMGDWSKVNLFIKALFGQKKIIIFTCLTGPGIFESLIHITSKKTKIVYFPHSFGFHSTPNSIRVKRYSKIYNYNSSVLVPYKKSFKFFSNIGFLNKNIIYTGVPCFEDNWLNKITKNQIKKKEKLKVFVALRSVHKKVLTSKNYEYLWNSLIKIFNNYKNYNFILKLHPRQKEDININKLLKQYKNIHLSNKSTFEIAKFSDLTISFWSSAIIESLAVGTPVLEFHKFHQNHPELTIKNGKFISMFQKYKLCKSFDDYNELKNFLHKINKKNLIILREKQLNSFNKIYKLENNNNNLISSYNDIIKKLNLRKVFDVERYKSIRLLTKNIFLLIPYKLSFFFKER